jgi:cardiolipin synthase
MRGAIEPLIDGDAFFSALVQAIQDARESIDIRLYIFDRDDYALRIAELLRRRSFEVRVRIVLDYLGTMLAAQVPSPALAPYAGSAAGGRSILDFLRRDSRIEVRTASNPWLTADHAKLIVVDRRLAFLGGMNIGREYRYAWHDMMVAVRGPVVGHLARDFERRWAHAGPGGDIAYAASAALSEAFEGEVEHADYVPLRALYTRTGDSEILRTQLAAMQQARSRIWVQQPYVSDDAIVAELIRARRRGVDVRVILPSQGDSGFMNQANVVASNAFVRNGIRVYAFPGMTHVKAALYDGWACVGSANFDKLSLRINQETDLATSDPAFVGRLQRDLFERDFARSREVLAPRSIGWGTYLGSFIANQL